MAVSQQSAHLAPELLPTPTLEYAAEHLSPRLAGVMIVLFNVLGLAAIVWPELAGMSGGGVQAR